MLKLDSKYTVLIVDDVPENIQVLSSLLEQKGITIFIAQSGRDALEIVARNPPDLILLDIMMPGMTGFDVCAHLKQDPAAKAIPIIFLTAKTDTADIVKGFEIGAVDYVTKPFHLAELLSRVFTHLELKKARDLITAQNQQLEQQNRALQACYARKEQQYRLLIENVADGIGIIREGKWVFVNDALSAMLGFTANQLIGNALLALVHEDYKAELRQTYQRFETGEFEPGWQVLQCIIRGDGRELWIEGRQSVIEWEGCPAILVSMRDISQHKFREIEIEREKEQLRAENVQLKASLKERYRFGKIVGKSQAMQEVYKLILDAAASDANVIICGESGTGKELMAQTIHALSNRQDKAFVPVNCGAIPEALFESEFFGHRKGSFTGAHRDKEGFFGLARAGSLFLDELEALSPVMQTKLLRAVEGGGYMPVGGDKIRNTDVRIIAATNRDLPEQVKQGLMRDDFFYRMYVIAITVPPLRERREDIPLLIDHFLKKYSAASQQPALSGKMLKALYDYDWPGNVRELQNTIQRFLTTGRLDYIGEKPLTSSRNLVATGDLSGMEVDQEGMDLQATLDEFEKRVLTKILAQNHWHRGKTAQMLHITERTLYRKMQKYQLNEKNIPR